jgi:hypothetical protein
MRPNFLLTGIFAMTIGCAPAPPEGEEPPAIPPAHSGTCDASKAQSLVGQAATSELAAEAQRLTGADTVRWLRPGQIVTMEFREGRLNIQIDEANRVIAIRCG